MPLKEPMLAAKATLKLLPSLKLPMLGSPKLDGYRAVNDGGRLLTRKLKLVPNEHTRSLFARPDMQGLDGELVVGPPNAIDVFRQTSSGVRRAAGEPDVKFYLFDDFTLEDQPFGVRIRMVSQRVQALKARGVPVAFVKHYPLTSVEAILAFEEKCLDHGYEGIMLRDPLGPYKEGRATETEGWLYKLKRMEDAEAQIVGVKEKMHNDNPAEINELGRTKRSGHKENKRPADTLGGLILRLPGSDITFNAPMGKGWDDDAKAALWAMRDQLPGQWVTFESFPIGKKDRPRFPKVKTFKNITVKGFRDMTLE